MTGWAAPYKTRLGFLVEHKEFCGHAPRKTCESHRQHFGSWQICLSVLRRKNHLFWQVLSSSRTAQLSACFKAQLSYIEASPWDCALAHNSGPIYLTLRDKSRYFCPSPIHPKIEMGLQQWISNSRATKNVHCNLCVLLPELSRGFCVLETGSLRLKT